MIRNLLLTAFRSLKRNKFFSILNILGLGIGLAVFLLIAQYVKFERSFENFVSNADNIYRVSLTQFTNNEQIFSSAENYPGVSLALKNELPEVEDCARLYNMGYKNNVIITYEDAKPQPIAFKHRRFLYADSSFLPMMGYPMVSGDINTALAQPFTAVITEQYAKMYFGNEDPIGKMLHMQDDDYNNELVRITGVLKDLPPNTHLKFDILFSYKTLYTRFDQARSRYDQSWARKDMYTFVRLAPGTDPKTVEEKFPTLVDKYKPQLKDRGQREILALQPLKSIHLTSALSEEPESNGDQKIVTFLSLIGIFVLVIAWINYINLSTAKAMERAKEVGVRKVMGAFRFQLMRQFLIEAGLINLLSILVAFLIVLLALPYFNSLSGLPLTASYLIEPWFLSLLAMIWVVGTVLSGFYPAIVLSSFKPVVVLKGKLKNSIGGILMRKGLVVFQFMTSVALIAGTFIVYKQLNFMMNRNIGVNIDQVMVVERPGIAARDRTAFNSSVDVFRNEIKKDAHIQALAASVTIPGKQRELKAGTKKYGASDDQLVSLRFNSMDYNFMEVFKMQLIAGRTFSEQFIHDQDTSVIVSESAAKLLGFKTPEEAIGQTVTIPEFGWSPIIVGVVNDYHQVSLKKNLDPMIFYCTTHTGEYYSLRVNTDDLPKTINHVRESWAKAFPGNPFEYFFLDDYFNKQYENERKFGKLFTVFAALAIAVGCLGLFGLSAYTATQRTKEIGIRKVLGSTESGIFTLLSTEYLKLVTLSILLAAPLVWFFMRDWVNSFPYHTTISVWIFLLSGLVVLVISLFTVSYQTVKAARANPINSLRYE